MAGRSAKARIGYEASPNDLLSMRRLAVLLLDFGQYPDWVESGEITERTLEIDPDNPAAWRALALVKAKLGDFQAAQVAMEKAVELAPRDYQIRSNFVRLLNDRGMRKRGSCRTRRIIASLGRAGWAWRATADARAARGTEYPVTLNSDQLVTCSVKRLNNSSADSAEYARSRTDGSVITRLILPSA